jgi:hypothetical protein
MMVLKLTERYGLNEAGIKALRTLIATSSKQQLDKEL